MDPVSAIGLASALLGIGELIGKSLLRLSSLQSKYRSSSLVITLLTGQMTTLRAALNQIAGLVNSNVDGVAGHEQLVLDLNVAVDTCKILISELETRISQVERSADGTLSAKGKLWFLLEESGLKEFAGFLDHQTNAFNLLVSAITCRSTLELNAVLQSRKMRMVLKRVELTRSSLLSLRSTSDSTSKLTENSLDARSLNIQETSVRFQFDGELSRSDVYRATALRSNPKRAASTNDAIQATRPTIVPSSSSPVFENGTMMSSYHDFGFSEERMSAGPSNRGQLSQSRLRSLAFRNWFGNDGIITKTTDIDRFSSRLSREGSILSNPPPFPQTDKLPLNILLFGSSKSGKSTLFKSIEALCKGGMSFQIRLEFRDIILASTIESIRNVLLVMKDLNIPLGDESNKHYVKALMAQATTPNFADLCDAIEVMWKDEGVQKAFHLSSEYGVQDSVSYFLNSIPRLQAADYIPSEEDVLMTRIKTSGLFSTLLTYNSIPFQLTDSGGERSERKKWIHAFPKMHSLATEVIIFTVDSSAFDCTLSEDWTANRLVEDLILFEGMCNSSKLAKARFVLLFTKMDFLEEKIGRVKFSKHVEGFEGDEESVEEVMDWIEGKFRALNRDPQRDILVKYTSLKDGYECLASGVLDTVFEVIFSEQKDDKAGKLLV